MTAQKKEAQHNPPKGVQKACERGLKLHKEGKGGKGLVQHTIDCAKDMAKGKAVSTHQTRRMSQWFARHETDKKPGWHRPPTPGYVAWLLWGGDAGMRWANSKVRQSEKKG